MARSLVGLLQPLAWLALVAATACGDSSANDGDSFVGETHDGPLDAPGDGDPGEGNTAEGNTGDGDGDTGDGNTGDGDGDSGDGDGEPGDGDGDPPPGCGNGMLDPGEGCDDGNNEPGDGCSMYCQLPGAVIWDVVIDIDDQQLDEVGRAVVVDVDGSTNVIVEQNFAFLLARFDFHGELEWSTSSVSTERASLVLGLGGQLIAGGQLGTQGVIRAWDDTGTEIWTVLLVSEDSSILGLAIDAEENLIASGRHPGPNGYLARNDPRGMPVWEQMQGTAGALGPVAAGNRIWVDRKDSDALERYTLDGDKDSQVMPLDGETVRDIVMDEGGNVYVLTEAADQSELLVARYDPDGVLLWTQVHGGDVSLVSGGGLSLLPNGGGLVVVGTTNLDVDTSDALLIFYDLDGGMLADDVLIDEEDVDALYDVTVTPFNYAIAVGERRAAGSDSDLWIRKFEI